MSDRANRVLLIGLDGADWRLLMPLIDAGAMPNLQRIIERGTSGKVAAPVIVDHDVAWACALTGLHAHSHGLLDSSAPSDFGRGQGPPMPTARCAPVVWEIAARAGVECIAIGWGTAIGECERDEAAAMASCEGPTSARMLADDLADTIGGRLDPRDQPLLGRLCAILLESELTARRAMRAMSGAPWRLASVRLRAFGDALGECARFVAPVPRWVLPRRAEAFASAMEELCRLHDNLIGQLASLCGGQGDAIAIASPRGTPLERLRSDPAAPSLTHLPSRPAGIIAMCGPQVRHDALEFGMRALDICPTILSMVGCSTPAGVHGRVARGADAMSGSALHADMRGLGTCTPSASAQPSYGAPHPVVQLPEAHARDTSAAWARRARALADSLADAGLHAEAAQVMEQVAAAMPTDPRASLRACELLRDAGRVDDALDRLRSVGDVPDDLSVAHTLVTASLHAAAGRQRDAIAALRREQDRMAPSSCGAAVAALHVACAVAHSALGMPEDALRACDAALAADPQCRDAHAERARTLYAVERYADALQSARDALSLAHFDAHMHLLAGTALAALGRPHEAVDELLVAVDQDPYLVAAFRRLAAVHIRQLRDAESARVYAARAAQAKAAIEARTSSAPAGW